MLPEFSVVLSTYNRAPLLGGALESLLALAPDSPAHELIVVDNNSTDDTRAVVEAHVARSGGRMRYVFEGRQGLAHARNAGVVAARGRYVAFTDDDVRADRDWLTALGRAFAAHPEVDYVGGRVLPMWPTSPPAWLTDWFWSPLAICDYGATGRAISAEAPDDYVTLVGANLAVRREVFAWAGGFDPRYQHERGAVTACEDHEFEMRLVHAGARGWYEPSAVIHAEVQPNRLTLAYHRKWAFDHGRATTRLTPPGQVFDGKCTFTPRPPWGRTLFGAPRILYAQTAALGWGWLRSIARRDGPGRLWHEFKALHSFGELHYYLTARRRDPEGRELAGSPPRLPVSVEPSPTREPRPIARPAPATISGPAAEATAR